jgi:hypothetical protein
VLDERDDIAYSKVFFRKGGYIAKKWYPYFLAARRNNLTFSEAHSDGLYSHNCKKIFSALSDYGALPLHEIKRLSGIGQSEKAVFDKALTDLQSGLFITMCGIKQKQSKTGEEYGWASTMFCITEEFWPKEVFETAESIGVEEAQRVITEQIYKLNPNADSRKIKKFIFG